MNKTKKNRKIDKDKNKKNDSDNGKYKEKMSFEVNQNSKNSRKNKKIKYKTIKYKQHMGLLDDEIVVNTNVNLKPFEKDHEDHFSDKQLIMTNDQVKKTFIKQLLAPFSPSSIKPTSNFYNYINYLWLKTTKLEDEKQKYITQIDSFRLVQDKIYNQLHDIVIDYIKNNNNRLSRNLSNYYKTVVSYNSAESARKYAKEYTLYVDDLRKDKKNLWKLLANVNHHEIIGTFAPFYWSIKPDEKNSNIFECYLEPHAFNIVDFSVYIDDGTNVEYKESYRRALKKTYRRVFKFILGPNNIDINSIYDIEVKMFNALFCDNKSTDASQFNSYNRIHKDEALSKYGFNWAEFCKEFGFTNANIPEFFICKNLNYLKCCTELLLNEWNSEAWRPYWLLIIYRKIVRITKASRHIFFDFFGKFQRGESGAIYKSVQASTTIFLSYPFNAFLTREYMKKYYDAKKIDFIRVLAEDLRVVFIRIIKRNTWLSEKTKNYAIRKLKSIKFILAQPPEILQDPDLDYCSDDLYKNMNTVSEWRHRLFIQLVGKKVIDYPILDWKQYPAKMISNQSYVVNAYYTPFLNSIYIPLGYIQEPFIDLNERGIEYNLANIGFTIAHELSHSLDELGSKYNIKGNLDNWWTESDTKKYKSIQEDIIKQYEEFALRDGIKFNASLSIGEDLADISGLAICEEYLRDYQENNNMLTPNRAHSFHQFYTYYCIQMRQIIPKKALMAQLNTNPHPLDVYRCNVPLTRSQVFRALYNVKKGDGMWWHNTDTVW
jgi:predicted metalloendopeptidase